MTLTQGAIGHAIEGGAGAAADAENAAEAKHTGLSEARRRPSLKY